MGQIHKTIAGVGMWKTVVPGFVALVTVGLSLVSGEVIRRETETKQLAALRPKRMNSPALVPASKRRTMRERPPPTGPAARSRW